MWQVADQQDVVTDGSESAQPDWTTARRPARLTAAETTSWSRSWLGVMLPNPTNTGGEPPRRKSTS